MSVSYERVEHRVIRSSDRDKDRILDDRTYRVVPTGLGTMKLPLSENGHAISDDEYHLELLDWERALQVSLDPNDPRVKASIAKAQKREQERNELVEGVRESFCVTWLGAEMHNNHLFDIVQLDPNPSFRPHTIAQDVLTHIRAKVWIDDQSGQLARAEADITRDISFGAFLGKIYRGGHFEVIQGEVAPGLWLPVRYQYDYVGRKFLFRFETHEITEISHYRRIGPANDALQAVRTELQSPADASRSNALSDP